MVRRTERAETGRGRGVRGARAGVLALGLSIGLVGCSDLLDVENPNNIKQEDLEKPVAASAVAYGVLANLTEAFNAVNGPYATLGDEVMWIGSRDAWNQIDQGNPTDPNNEFTDSAFPSLAQARWWADEGIRLLEGYSAEGKLEDPTLLAQVYMYSAIVYITIADMYEDFAFSDRTESAEPVGPDNMDSLYDTAIEKLNSGRTIAQAEGDDELALTMLALRARAYHAKAVWQMLNPYSPGDGLVSDASASADAAAVIADLGVGSDWKFQLTNDNQVGDVARVGEVSLAYNVNNRGELQIGTDYVTLSADLKDITGTALMDPIDGVADPALTSIINEFVDGFEYPPFTMVSAREMHLLLAEAALADGDEPTAELHINHVRTIDADSTMFDYTDGAQPDTRTMLIHERRTNLFLQGRRVADMYRFGETDALWLPGSPALTSPGAVFPVTSTELRSNCLFPNNQC